MTIEEAFTESLFQVEFLKQKGDSFESFFDKVMGLAHKEDYMGTRPWGRHGDRKNDGYLKSEKTLFQVYAPNEMNAKKAEAKIREDFAGAKLHWEEHVDKWTFVHNTQGELPPHVIKLILELDKKNPEIEVSQWGYHELLERFRSVSITDRESWLGAVPNEQTKADLDFKELRIVLESIAGKPAKVGAEVIDVPPGKIEANALSSSIEDLIRNCISKTPLVEEFFRSWHDESLGEKTASAFNEKYKELKLNKTPNETFYELQKWAGGTTRGKPEHELAVLTVLAYYFERCDIFEAPRI
tara:strand:- start:8239 stop:9132 length:894 start_codon:yes stop_codon:yes gene_type:complete